jgi:hypothetical protein
LEQTSGLAVFDSGGRLRLADPGLAGLLGLTPEAPLAVVEARLAQLDLSGAGRRGGLAWRRIALPPGPAGGEALLVERERAGPPPACEPGAHHAHELRTPLCGLLGDVDNLADGIHGPLPAGATETVQRLRWQGLRLLHAVEEVLGDVNPPPRPTP